MSKSCAVPDGLIELKSIYHLKLNPGAYYYDPEKHEFHSGSRYKFRDMNHSWVYDRPVFVLNDNRDYLSNFECINFYGKIEGVDIKNKTYGCVYDKLLEDIKEHPEWFY